MKNQNKYLKKYMLITRLMLFCFVLVGLGSISKYGTYSYFNSNVANQDNKIKIMDESYINDLIITSNLRRETDGLYYLELKLAKKLPEGTSIKLLLSNLQFSDQFGNLEKTSFDVNHIELRVLKNINSEEMYMSTRFVLTQNQKDIILKKINNKNATISADVKLVLFNDFLYVNLGEKTFTAEGIYKNLY